MGKNPQIEAGSDVLPSSRQSDSLKLWIELIRCSNQLERTIDKNLRRQFGQSISRFDVLSQLQRKLEDGLTVGELGKCLIASKGNITGLLNRMVKDGLVIKVSKTDDRRCFQVNITSKGLALFKDMADNHGKWITDYFISLDIENMKKITQLLGETRLSLSLTTGS